MNKINFPGIRAWPCNLQDTSILNMLSDMECEERIKEEFKLHIDSCFMAHRYDYPKVPKEIYIVPFLSLKESREAGLRPAKFSMLWLPSIAIDIQMVREIVPEGLKENPIVAWDNEFSILRGGNVLHLDPGFGKSLLILTKNQGNYPNEWQFLAELI